MIAKQSLVEKVARSLFKECQDCECWNCGRIASGCQYQGTWDLAPDVEKQIFFKDATNLIRMVRRHDETQWKKKRDKIMI